MSNRICARQENIEEIIDLANEAISHLYDAREGLNAARDWGIVDIVGGGLIVTAIKQQRISDARVQIAYANDAICQLQRHLVNQLGIRNIDFEMSELVVLADYLFDNPITDIYVQNQIVVAKEQVDQVIRQTEKFLQEIYSV